MRSYVITHLGVVGRINEAWNLYRGYTRGMSGAVRRRVEQARDAEKTLSASLGVPVAGLTMLEIGPGQHRVQLAYFAVRNEVVGIDLDVIIERVDIRSAIRMVRNNGWLRTCKTIGRKFLRIDSRLRRELVSQLGLKQMVDLNVLQMDAGHMDFADKQFDVVFSRAVFEHLPDPAAVIREIRRVLKPGGAMLIRLHLFTSDTGCHDARILRGKRGDLPLWAHLREEYKERVRPNSYLNKLSLDEWNLLFHATMPGSEIVALCDAGDVERRELAALRAQGELSAYSDEELLTVTVEVRWRKPFDPFSGADDATSMH